MKGLKILILSFIILVTNVYASTIDKHGNVYPTPQKHHLFYIGTTLGYGNTDWGELVDKSGMTSTSTPMKATDSGFAWGFLAGFEFSRLFAIEADYTRYPDSEVTLSQYSFYWPITKFKSKTYSASLNGKFMVPICDTGVRAFASVGVGYIHRKDVILSKGRVTPVFGAGFNYIIHKHILTEVGFQYYAGYGKSALKPLDSYIPFIYTVHLRLAYMFNL